ncbi:hypothetical protein NBRC116584_10090 [Hydrogenophaga sp. 5NK40-0174]
MIRAGGKTTSLRIRAIARNRRTVLADSVQGRGLTRVLQTWMSSGAISIASWEAFSVVAVRAVDARMADMALVALAAVVLPALALA